MKGCAIICEYNPFHNGHAYHIARAKEESSLPVVCVMSGDFVQRGEYAKFDKYKRAHWATMSGADLVLELPYPFSCASAEIFAKSAVSIIVNTGLCTALSFGCTEKIEKLLAVSRIFDEDFEEKVKEKQKENKNLSFAQARASSVCEAFGKEYAEIIKEPNNILAIEYLKAINSQGAQLDLYPVQRKGAKHSENFQGEFASASYIRENLEKCKDFVPSYVYDELFPYQKIDENRMSAALLSKIALSSPHELAKFAEVSGGFEYSLLKYAKKCKSISSLYEELKSKHLTDAKIRRAVLYSFLETAKEQLLQMPQYTSVLDFSPVGAKLLKSIKGESKIKILSKTADIKDASEKAREQYEKALLARTVFQKFFDEY